jgi:hypothetical protein
MQDPLIQEVLMALDQMETEVTTWEAGFIESLLSQTFPCTAKQRTVLIRMADRYLDPLLVAELYGQQRLFT